MKNMFLAILLTIPFAGIAQKRNPKNKAIFLEDISWTTAKLLLTPDAVVVIPLGAGAKEHGPHLPLSTDFIQADGCRDMLALERKVFIAPTLNYGYYPAFIKYAGSTTLNHSTAIDVVLQVIRSLSNYGPKRFYIINIGVSTTPTLEAAAKILADEGILLYFSRYDRPDFKKTEDQFRTQPYGGHADEMETSNVLSLRADLVDMKKAVDDSSAKNKPGILTPVPLEGGVTNTSGINGYATLGTKEKGRLSMSAYTKVVIKDIDSITTCALPLVKNRSAEYQKYEGTYTDAAGKKLVIDQKDNLLYFVWNGRNLKNFMYLHRDAEDFYTSLMLNVLFVKNENGEVTKAWCSYRGENFWVTKSK
jgi:creatinine amidohydrolase